MRIEVALLMSLTLLAGCPDSVLPEYEAARQAALTEAKVPRAWNPDAVLHITEPLLERLVAAGLSERGELNSRFSAGSGLGRATVTPKLRMSEMGIRGTRRCDGCLAVEPRITGELEYQTRVASGSIPVDARAEVDVEIRSQPADGGFEVTGKPVSLHGLELTLGKGKTIGKLLEGPLSDRIEERLLSEGRPTVITHVPDDAPVMAVAVVPTQGGLGVKMLTNSPTPGKLDRTRRRAETGWQLDISEQSLVGLAARASFEKGPVAQGIVVVPTAIDFDTDGFTMDIRLWGTTGRGWWRDYTITGNHRVEGKRLHLAADEVAHGPTSKGAAMADPLVALAQGIILSTIEDSVRTAIPAYQSADKGDFTYTVDVRSAAGEVDGVLTLRGDILVSDKAKRPPRVPER